MMASKTLFETDSPPLKAVHRSSISSAAPAIMAPMTSMGAKAIRAFMANPANTNPNAMKAVRITEVLSFSVAKAALADTHMDADLSAKLVIAGSRLLVTVRTMPLKAAFKEVMAWRNSMALLMAV